MARFFQIARRIIWGVVEVVIVLSVLNTITNNDTALTVSVLGLIYATVRSTALGSDWGRFQMALAYDVQFYDLKRRLQNLTAKIENAQPDLVLDRLDPPDTEALLSKGYINFAITGFFIAAVYFVCLYQFFSRLR